MAAPMMRALVIVGVLGLLGCRDYRRLEPEEGADGAVGDLGNADLAGADASQADGGLPGDLECVPPSMSSFTETAVLNTANLQQQLITGRFIPGDTLDVVALVPSDGFSNKPLLEVYRKMAGSLLLQKVSDLPLDCGSSIAALHDDGGAIDRVAVACADCAVGSCGTRILSWNGTQFVVPAMITVPSGNAIKMLAGARVDLDGNDDLVAIERDDSSNTVVSVSFGDGLGGFNMIASHLFFSSLRPLAVAVGAFDPLTNVRRVVLLSRDVAGTAELATFSVVGRVLTRITPSPFGALPEKPTGMVAIDALNSGHPSLVVTNEGTKMLILTQRSQDTSIFVGATGAATYAPVVFDWNLDGKKDVFVLKAESTLLVPTRLLNQSVGTTLDFGTGLVTAYMHQWNNSASMTLDFPRSGVAVDVDQNCAEEVLYLDGKSTTIWWGRP